MTTQQQAHNMIDRLNLNGLNYIISVLNGLSDDNWVNVPITAIPAVEKTSEKQAAFKRLEARRKKYAKLDIEDFDAAKADGILGKWGDTH